jgi:DNA uptake protein ComE-like DNA-binding protein
MMHQHRPASRLVRVSRRGFATLLVFGIIVLAAVIIGSVQLTAYGQASAGRESLARVRATWAARAGVECTIARLEFLTENPPANDGTEVMFSMQEVAQGLLPGAEWRIATSDGKNDVLGPADAHAKINVNAATRDQLLAIEPFMSDDVIDAILDWIDPDDDVNPLGAELGYYQTLPNSYQPRNDFMLSIQELELVAGVSQQDVRGEDWNLNGILDPNEDDGDLSWPPDNADGVLDAGWSGVLTVYSREGTLAPSGQPRLDLMTAAEGDLISRFALSQTQAKAVMDYVQNTETPVMSAFIRRTLAQLQAQATGAATPQPQTRGRGGRQQPRAPQVEALSDDQLRSLLSEATIGEPSVGVLLPGKVNINTCPAEVLQYLPEINPEIADAIIAERSSRPEGFTSVMDLADVPGMTRAQLAVLYDLVTVRSNVFIVTSRGRDDRTGLEVEMRAVLDRSTLPVTLTEVIIR